MNKFMLSSFTLTLAALTLTIGVSAQASVITYTGTGAMTGTLGDAVYRCLGNIHNRCRHEHHY